jgi:MFS family permease
LQWNFIHIDSNYVFLSLKVEAPQAMQKIQLGLKENWKQFTLLVIINAFVGGMVGLERTIIPQFAEDRFGISSTTAILSFIAGFGLSKALANYFMGKLADSFGRKNLLIAGWFLAIPIPFLLIYAQSWNWVLVANVLLGVSQGLTWSSTVVMKIDLVGEKERGFAMGLNEFAGYLSVGLVAFLTAFIATRYGITPYPFYLGVFISIIGLLLSILFVKDTADFVKKSVSHTLTEVKTSGVFWETTFKNKTLSAVTQAGLINNLNDGMIWGLLPILLSTLIFKTQQIGVVTAVYPAIWGIGQLFTGRMSDIYSKKKLLFWGMLIQGLAILFIPLNQSYFVMVSLMAVLGLGTAMVYPTFLATIAEVSPPVQRAESIGVFRLWRDLGYVFGALISGVLADTFGLSTAIFFIGGLTLLSAGIIHFRIPKS